MCVNALEKAGKICIQLTMVISDVWEGPKVQEWTKGAFFLWCCFNKENVLTFCIIKRYLKVCVLLENTVNTGTF